MAGANGRPAHDSRDVDSNAVPTGWRPSVDKQEAKELAARDPHVQTIEDSDVYLLEPFAGCQFVAHIKKDLKIAANGDMEIVFTIPYQFKHLAYPLSDVMMRPLSVDIQTWEPYDKAMEET